MSLLLFISQQIQAKWKMSLAKGENPKKTYHFFTHQKHSFLLHILYYLRVFIKNCLKYLNLAPKRLQHFDLTKLNDACA